MYTKFPNFDYNSIFEVLNLKFDFMKKIYLTILSALIFGLVNAQSPQINNSGFEYWSSTKKASGWSSTNDYIGVFGAQNVFQETSIKKSGSFSIKLTTINGQPVVASIPGFITNGSYGGNISDFKIEKIVPVAWIYSERPDSVVGYYNYAPAASSNDSATFVCRFFKNRNLLGQGLYQEGNNTGGFKRMSMNIEWDNGLPSNTMPDSMLIFISSSAVLDVNHAIGSSLYVDNLGFAGLTGIKSINVNTIKLMPNPAKNYISIKGLKSVSYDVNVLNALGSVVLKTNTLNGTIDIEKLSPGVYFLEAISDQEKITQRFVKE